MKIEIDLTQVKAGFRSGHLVWVADKTDGNYGQYGHVSSNLPKNLRSDWLEKLRENPPFGDRLYVVVDFGGYQERWSKLYHVSQLIDVSGLGIYVIKQIKASDES